MKSRLKIFPSLGLAILALLVLPACGKVSEGIQSPDEDKIKVVVTTTFIADVVKSIAGDHIEVRSLLSEGQNPHSYHPSPMDMVAITEADLIMANGFGLEEFLDDLLAGTDTEAELIVVSEGISPLILDHDHQDDEEGNHDDDDSLDAVMGQDPHVWFDPNNILIWSENIRQVLIEIDPENAASYTSNAEDYQNQLRDLDAWIREQVSKIPADQREIVTDHTTLGYFAEEYGLVQIGAVIPAMTTEAETSGMELANLIDTIREYQVSAIFVGVDFDPSLASRVADETGVDLVPIYFGSLSIGEPADTYFSFMRFNVNAIVEALQ